MSIKTPKKLIEVALPLDDINAAAAKEKSIRHGHPSTLHLWWARRPLAAARAVIFAQMVNDPGGERGYYAGKTKEQANREREELFDIIRDLVKWENTDNQAVLNRARAKIKESWRETCAMNKGKPGFDPETLPPFHDPFAGGGAIPLEAQRLGLDSHASDLNPVAVMINKAMIEIPTKFEDRRPVGPVPTGAKQMAINEVWRGPQGLAEDVRRYGGWIRNEALNRIGHFYPEVELPNEYGGGKATVIAWIWARTVKSPNPAFSHVEVPLVSNFFLSTKPGKQAWVEPVIDGEQYHFTIQAGTPKNVTAVKNGTKLARGANFRCLLSDTPIEPAYIKAEGIAGRLGSRLMAVVVEGRNGRIYLEPQAEMEALARSAQPHWRPEASLPDDPRNFWTLNYGLTTFADLFTPRQLVALSTFSDLVLEARDRAIADALTAGWSDDGIGLEAGGTGATAYGDAIALYLAFAVDRVVDRHSAVCTWDSSPSKLQLRNTFARQAIPMTWDYAEGNPFCMSSGTWTPSVEWVYKAINSFPRTGNGVACQADAASGHVVDLPVISTDPPYYDNIGYADLSDFFYVWLRRSLRGIFPSVFVTMSVPKTDELVATPYRHGSKEEAESFFLKGMTRAMNNMERNAHPAFPVTIYYAFKQSETQSNGTSSTGWETFLDAVLKAGFSISGTWPMRTELANRMISSGTNALASSIVLVCRQRDAQAAQISRREFLRELKEVLPESLEAMIGGRDGSSPIAPVDLAQAAIGPGMAVFSKYSVVLEADGSAMTVHTALTLINKALDEYFSEAEGDLDADTRFCLGWFEECGWSTDIYDKALVLARAKGTSVENAKAAGVVESSSGKVRLLKVSEYPSGWSPERDNRTPVWEATHHLIRALQMEGETESGALLARMPERTESIRQLAYRLYTLCERKGWAEEARSYNELITSWHAIETASHEAGRFNTQLSLDLELEGSH